MELQTIPLDRLAVSALNMRALRKKPFLDDILPSIRERGVLVPLLVRPNGEPDHFEIVAGRRRFLASKTIAIETGEARDLPCRVLSLRKAMTPPPWRPRFLKTRRALSLMKCRSSRRSKSSTTKARALKKSLEYLG